MRKLGKHSDKQNVFLKFNILIANVVKIFSLNGTLLQEPMQLAINFSGLISLTNKKVWIVSKIRQRQLCPKIFRKI